MNRTGNVLVVIITIISFLLIPYWIILYHINGYWLFKYPINVTTLGVFGDFLGGFIGTIFTIITTLIVWLTFRSQREELNRSSELIIQQRFEDTFFKMMDQLFELVTHMEAHLIKPDVGGDYLNRPDVDRILQNNMDFDYNDRSETYKKLEFFNIAIQQLKLIYNEETIANGNILLQQERIKTIFDCYARNFLDELDNYFRLFFNILKFIHHSSVKNKKLYADILQSKMSNYELSLIFYNGLGTIGSEKLFPYLERYNFLENVNDLYIVKEHYIFYPRTRFRFLEENVKHSIVLKQILENPDRVDNNNTVIYYLKKYTYNKKLANELIEFIQNNEVIQNQQKKKVIKELNNFHESLQEI